MIIKMRWFFIFIFVVYAFTNVKADNMDRSVKDSIDENFVIASVLLAEPGGALYSNVGHVALRLQCPEHQLDYIFSY